MLGRLQLAHARVRTCGLDSVWAPQLGLASTTNSRTILDLVTTMSAILFNVGWAGRLAVRAGWRAGEKPPPKMQAHRDALGLEKRLNNLAPLVRRVQPGPSRAQAHSPASRPLALPLAS